MILKIIFIKVIEWIELNRDLIIEYWFDDQMYAKQFSSKMKHG